jgi:hypothetical protein
MWRTLAEARLQDGAGTPPPSWTALLLLAGSRSCGTASVSARKQHAASSSCWRARDGGCFCPPVEAERASVQAPRRERAVRKRQRCSRTRWERCLDGARLGHARCSIDSDTLVARSTLTRCASGFRGTARREGPSTARRGFRARAGALLHGVVHGVAAAIAARVAASTPPADMLVYAWRSSGAFHAGGGRCLPDALRTLLLPACAAPLAARASAGDPPPPPPERRDWSRRKRRGAAQEGQTSAGRDVSRPRGGDTARFTSDSNTGRPVPRPLPSPDSRPSSHTRARPDPDLRESFSLFYIYLKSCI